MLRMITASKILAGVVATSLALCAAYWLGSRQVVAPASPMVQANTRPAGPAALADPYVTGPVKNTLRKQTAAMQQLWIAYLARPQAKDAGTVEIDWRIDSKGKAVQVAVVTSTLNDKVLEEGLLQIIAGLNFPVPDVPEKYVVHKFNFKRENAPR